MNLKYYLRGLGLGIIITAVIMGLATGGKREALTNEEIITRARALGMVENKVLTEYTEEVKEGDVQESTDNEVDNAGTKAAVKEQEILSMDEAGKEADDAADLKDTLSDLDTDTAKADSDRALEDEAAGTVDVEAEEPEPTIFSVKKGEAPYSICKRLVEIDLISSADDFDTYLLNNGYDRKIVAAEYKIPSGASEEDIATIITGGKIENAVP
ncbi:hypothetical protein [Kineothrix sedimenti]|uniref:YceG-like family protein n=1 Tax=Kineothrix sedimenti TaxID=3123317 RepID=A0ABZ3F3U9_9FIRM